MKIKIAYALMASALLTLGACSEGKYWNEPDSYGNTVEFAKPAASVTVAADAAMPTSYDVTLYRTDSSTEQTYNITVDTKAPEVISGPATVTFAAGSNSAVYTLSIADALPGVQYSAEVSVDHDGGLISDSENSSFTLRLFQNLVWNAAGTAELTSYGWVEDEDENPMTVTVNVEEAVWPVAGERLFRLVDPYHALEPQYADTDASIGFFTDDEGNALRMYQEWQYIGEMYDDVEYLMFGCPAAYGASFTNEGTLYIMDGIIGTAADLYGDVAPGWYETLGFVWTCPAK